MTVDINYLYDHRSEPDARAVLEDWERSRYRTSTVSRLGFALSFIRADAAADAADDDADADDAADIRRMTSLLSEEPDMSPGLKVVQIQITYYRTITFVGWLRRVSGDEYELIPGTRIVTRKSGEAYSWNGIDEMNHLGMLRGKVLGCFCKPKACHGDVLVKLVEEQFGAAP